MIEHETETRRVSDEAHASADAPTPDGTKKPDRTMWMVLAFFGGLALLIALNMN